MRDEEALIAALRQRDEQAFCTLVAANSPIMLRVARGYVGSDAAAEEVVQEAWIALLKGIDGFEGRSTLRTWLLSVVVNIAKRRGVRDSKAATAERLSMSLPPTVDPARFRPAGDPYPRHWIEPPAAWRDVPEDRALSDEFVAALEQELARLPERQRTVVTLRDVLGYDSEEVCAMLGLSTENQRVLLHRGRARLRGRLEEILGD